MEKHPQLHLLTQLCSWSKTCRLQSYNEVIVSTAGKMVQIVMEKHPQLHLLTQLCSWSKTCRLQSYNEVIVSTAG
jgi:hypothetical protein